MSVIVLLAQGKYNDLKCLIRLLMVILLAAYVLKPG